MKISIGFLEIMFAGGIFLYQHAFALSLILIVLSSLLKFCEYILEYNKVQKREETVQKHLDGLGEKIQNLFSVDTKSYEKKTFH